jgi:hypothetical protein
LLEHLEGRRTYLEVLQVANGSEPIDPDATTGPDFERMLGALGDGRGSPADPEQLPAGPRPEPDLARGRRGSPGKLCRGAGSRLSSGIEGAFSSEEDPARTIGTRDEVEPGRWETIPRIQGSGLSKVDPDHLLFRQAVGSDGSGYLIRLARQDKACRSIPGYR